MRPFIGQPLSSSLQLCCLFFDFAQIVILEKLKEFERVSGFADRKPNGNLCSIETGLCYDFCQVSGATNKLDSLVGLKTVDGFVGQVTMVHLLCYRR